MSAFVHLEDTIIQTLRAHLNFGHAELTQPADFIRRDLIGPRLDHKTDIAMRSGFVEGLCFI